MGALTAIVTLTVTALFNQWKSYLFDEEFTSIRGINVVFLEYLLMVLTAMSVVSLIRVVGIVLFLASGASIVLLAGITYLLALAVYTLLIKKPSLNFF